MIVGITRVRNESLIIADTIQHFLGYCDHIFLYDDCSTDATVHIAKTVAGDRLTVIQGDRQRLNRHLENTRHRHILLEEARKTKAEWCLCFDADERLVGPLPDTNQEFNGYRFRLFDGYLTEGHQDDYTSGDLAQLPRMWGPEYRAILMLFRISEAVYKGTGLREPWMKGRAVDQSIALASVVVRHYGKCMSIEHWEETCKYYMKGFHPSYYRRWAARVGKAIHTASDFNRPLHTWEYLMSEPDLWVKI